MYTTFSAYLPEQVEAARKLMEEKGCANSYLLVLTVPRHSSSSSHHPVTPVIWQYCQTSNVSLPQMINWKAIELQSTKDLSSIHTYLYFPKKVFS